MMLNNFIQLSNNLNQAYTLYLQIKQERLPLAKVTFTATGCFLHPGKQAMTKQHFFNLVRQIHQRQVTIWIADGKLQIPVYGLQVSIAQKTVTLM